ncbi:MAG TPA: hypothetical protein VI757_00330, partial [Bacteroidia bacterium]|nr:hypothetical protein [Bacteroidia bacterium]
MKKNILLLVSCFLLLGSWFLPLGSATAQTNVSGFISANTTWNLAGSPYVVVSNALLSHGYTLTIDPGVIVKFNSSCALQIDGELRAIGTPADRITFTSSQASPAAGNWAKVHFADTSVSATFDAQGNYLSGCIMKYCDVLYGGQLGYGEVHVETASPYISQCRIKFSSSAGVYCAGSTFLLDSSLVSDNLGYGLYFDQFSLFSCGLLINGDTIRSNRGGLYLGTSSTTTCTTKVTNNYFVLNTVNAAINDAGTSSNIHIENNFFLNNSSPSMAVINFAGTIATNVTKVKIIENNFSGNSTRG